MVLSYRRQVVEFVDATRRGRGCGRHDPEEIGQLRARDRLGLGSEGFPISSHTAREGCAKRHLLDYSTGMSSCRTRSDKDHSRGGGIQGMIS